MSVKLYLFTIVPLCSMVVFSEYGQTISMKSDASEIFINSIDKEGISYLALGDSYTIAECEVSANSYPNQLVNKIRKSGISVKSITTIARTGWRTDDLKNAILKAALKDTFDMVSLLIGVNNQYQGKSLEEYKIQFQDLLETAIVLAKGRKDKVFVVSIPDYGVTPFGKANEHAISGKIDLFNNVNREITLKVGVRYFDITPISREAKEDKSLICTDLLHPSSKMYARWVEHIFPEVLLLLSKP
ncbi:MAG TPA: SGNH/GDSL hydrolase family protein [Cytophagaceae bacterium]|jgi:lysophospholipase L1-like esterase|nr:SGNH/GDSL hydrolase family protein [Cytophagaceae bacterium]